MNPAKTLPEQFGRIDIYLFDQLWRGNIAPGMRVLDAGCGHGRNLVYLLREGYDVYGIDVNLEAIDTVRAMAQQLAPGLPGGNFQVAAIEAMPFPDAFADVVVCNSVLQFARDARHFLAMVRELWRVLRPGGLLFCRLASVIGAEGLLLAPVARQERMFHMPDGQVWFLVDEPLLMKLTQELGGEFVDPLKTTVVQGVRSMTTWVLRR